MLAVVLSAFAVAVAFAAPPLEVHQLNTAPCGQRPLASAASAISPLIVGGNEANPPFSYPWMCGLRSSSTSNPFCGASLIKNENNEYHLLTAAHCFRDCAFSNEHALCGAHEINSASENNRETLNFDELVCHPDFNPITLENDVAIIKLTNQPTESDYIGAVCLPSETFEVGEMVTATGWGRLNSGGPVPGMLMEVTKAIVSDSDCEIAYGSEFFASNMVCAADSGKDACQGDSGGPLVAYRNNAWVQVGIVSWGWGCAHPSYPGVYADVYALKDWILQNIQ